MILNRFISVEITIDLAFLMLSDLILAVILNFVSQTPQANDIAIFSLACIIITHITFLLILNLSLWFQYMSFNQNSISIILFILTFFSVFIYLFCLSSIIWSYVVTENKTNWLV
jgi:glucan phosphoethanolaminetransferase (alkaline phosphatase superfamily)